MSVQVIGSGGQQVTAVGVPTKRVYAAAVRVVTGSVVGAPGGGDGGVVNTVFTFDLDGLFNPADPTTNTPEQRFALIGQDANPSWNGVWAGTSDGVTPAAMEKVAELPGVDGYVACLYLATQLSELSPPLSGGFVLARSAQTAETLSGTGWYIAGRGTATGAALSDDDPVRDATSAAPGVSPAAARADHTHEDTLPPVSFVISGAADVANVETLLSFSGRPPGSLVVLGHAVQCGSFNFNLSLFPAGPVTGGDPGLWEWDGTGLSFVRPLAEGDRFAFGGFVLDDSGSFTGFVGHIGYAILLDLGGGPEMVLATASWAASAVSVDSTGYTGPATGVATVQELADAVDAIAAAASEWTEVARFTTVSTNDWPTFTDVPTADRYRLRWYYAPDHTPSLNGGLNRNMLVTFDSDGTLSYASGTTGSSTTGTALVVASAFGQGSGGFGEVEFLRSTKRFTSPPILRHGVHSSGHGVSGTGSVASALSLHHGTYVKSDGTTPPLATWAIASSNDDAWAAGITFILETADFP